MYKFKTIQALRALACIYVFLGHLIFYFQHLFPNRILKSLFYFGFSGINMFFVISGFVIYISTKNVEIKLVSFLNYLKKRLIRIFPMYWILFILFLFVSNSLNILTLKSIAGSFLLLPYHFPVFDVSWTLSFELYFYFLFGIGLIKKRFLIIPYTIFFTATFYFLLSTVGVDTSVLPLHQLLGYHVAEFFMGIIAGIFFNKIPLMVAYFLLPISLFFFFSRNLISGAFLNYSLPSLLLVSALAKIETEKKINIPALILILGDASYVIYLLHNPFLRDTVLSYLYYSSRLTIPGFFTLCLLTLIAGVVIHLYVEAPLIRYLNKRIIFK